MRSEVWAVADALRAASKRVSIRSVREALPRGGSHRSIGAHLAEWKAERSYQPRLELAQLPEGLQAMLVGFGKTVWEAALREATGRFEEDRRRLEDLRLHEAGLRDEALAATDAAEGRIAAAEERAARLADELTMARIRIQGLERKFKHSRATGPGSDVIKKIEKARANEFWNRVMAEVHGRMSRLETLGQLADGAESADLMAGISKELLAEADLYGEPLNAATLANRMGGRTKYAKFFTRRPSGRFVLLKKEASAA